MVCKHRHGYLLQAMGSFMQNQFLNRANVVSRCRELEKLLEAGPVVVRTRFKWGHFPVCVSKGQSLALHRQGA